MKTSMLHLHSLGTVTSNPKPGDKKIMARLKEKKFGNPDELLDNPTSEKVQYKSSTGTDELEVTHSDSVPATWLNINSNRKTAPNVRRGDEVLIWRVAETNQYLWQLRTGNNMRLETVIYAFSADPSKDIAEDYSNAYVFEVSGHNKSITLSTSKANGEPFAFTVQYDLENGVYINTDDVGNATYINSAQRIVGLQNGGGAKFELNQNDIHAECPGTFGARAKNIALAADSINMAADNISMAADAVAIEGAVGIKGAVNVTGSMKLNGRNVKTD